MKTKKELLTLKKQELIEYAALQGISVSDHETKVEIIENLIKEGKVAEEEKKEEAKGEAKKNETDEMVPESPVEVKKAPNPGGSRVHERSRNRARKTSAGRRKRSFTVDPNERFTPKVSKEEQIQTELRSSMNSTLTLQGVVSAVEEHSVPKTITEDGETKTIHIPICSAVVPYGHYKVLIPSDRFVNTKDRKGLEPLEIRSILENRMGATVDFKITHIDEDAPVATGDRLAAMEIIRRRMWFALEGERFKIRENTITEARIIAVIRQGMFVEVAGVETYIPSIELGFTPTNDATELFHTGDGTVDVLIRSIERNLETGEVSFKASVKETMAEEQKQKYDMIAKGSKCYGEVVKLNLPREKDGIPGALVNLTSGYMCYCHFRDVIPNKGDFVHVKIREKYDDTLRIFGMIDHIERRSV